MPNPPPETILVTGGTGSFGSAFARFLLAHTMAHVRILSRDEHKQNALAQELPPSARTSYIIADIREYPRLRQAVDGCTAIVHAAALKTVPGGERHASEFARTNITGTDNVINAALEARVPRTLFISSDKACNPLNLYGATKKVAESLVIQANALGVTRGCSFAAVRGGNVWASNGSVGTVWPRQIPIIVNDPTATRFHLQMRDWTAFVYHALNDMRGGEIYAPLAPAWNLHDLARALTPDMILGDGRPGDKQHETLVAADEAPRTVAVGWALVIEPPDALRAVWNYQGREGPRLTAAYSSDAVRRMGMEELSELWARPRL